MEEAPTPLLESNQEQNAGKYSMCIVWSPIPFLTWLVPFIGHLGIGTTNGEINDFAGSYYIHKSMSETSFGSVSKYWKVSHEDILCENYELQNVDEIWDESINEANIEFENRAHNLLCNNCHSHVAMALNRMKFRKSSGWNTFLLIVYMIVFSKFNGVKGFLNAYGGFLVILSIILTIIIIVKFT